MNHAQRIEILSRFSEQFDIGKFPCAYDSLLEQLLDREEDLEFEYDSRVAAEKRIEELKIEITELEGELFWKKLDK